MLGRHPVGVVLLSTDLPKSRAFYADALQLDIVEESDSAIAYASGATRTSAVSRMCTRRKKKMAMPVMR